MEKITKTKECVVYGEPFNLKLERNNGLLYCDVIKNNNVFVKTMIGQKPKEFGTMPHMEYYEKIKNDFDNIILLDRLNLQDQVESYSRAKMVGEWHEKYYYNEKMFMKEESLSREFINEMKKIMIDLSNFFDTKINYYEDIYGDKEKIKDFLSMIGVEFNEEYYNEHLDTSKKYRIEKPLITSLI
jgi:hypothetical protein